MKARLIGRKIVARKSIEVTFLLEKKISFLPGQYVTVRLINPKYSDYQENQRIFSLVNPPYENTVVKILFRVRESGFKKNLTSMPLGTRVEIEEPVGTFNLPASSATPLVFLAGGVGIAPFMSVLMNMRKQKRKNPTILFCSNRKGSETCYRSDILTLTKELANLEAVFVMTRDFKWRGERGRINISTIKKYVPKFAQANYYLAGTPEFVEALVEQLVTAGISKGKFSQESFDGY